MAPPGRGCRLQTDLVASVANSASISRAAAREHPGRYEVAEVRWSEGMTTASTEA